MRSTLMLLLGLLLMLLISPVIAISSGSASIDPAVVFRSLLGVFSHVESGSLSERIVIELRMPRVILAMVCGAGLATSGAVLQSVTRNPLADPYLFGISSGASLGAVVSITLGMGSIGLPMSAFCGALIAVGVVMLMSRDGRTERLILAGVAISFLLSALANLLLYFGDPQAMQAVMFWTMGSFARANWDNLLLPSLVLLVAFPLIVIQQPVLQALLAGDESAHTQGIAVQRTRLGLLLLTALITAALVANCGGIGFVGLMVPHMVRMLIGAGSVAGLFATAMLGALIMLWVDLLSRWLMPAQELPVGVVTAILGSLFFLFLLLRKRRY